MQMMLTRDRDQTCFLQRRTPAVVSQLEVSRSCSKVDSCYVSTLFWDCNRLSGTENALLREYHVMTLAKTNETTFIILPDQKR